MYLQLTITYINHFNSRSVYNSFSLWLCICFLTSQWPTPPPSLSLSLRLSFALILLIFSTFSHSLIYHVILDSLDRYRDIDCEDRNCYIFLAGHFPWLYWPAGEIYICLINAFRPFEDCMHFLLDFSFLLEFFFRPYFFSSLRMLFS